MSSVVVQPGHVIAGRYRVQGLLGQGAMGAVYRAVQLSVGRAVALKLLVDEHRDSAAYVERFEREAQALSRLSHPNTVRLFDFGTTAQGCPFLVMELLHGADLASDLARQGPLRWDQALAVVQGVAASLAEAHAAGIVHRDIKPANVFLCAGGVWPKVKVLDFGVARAAMPFGARQLTVAGTVVGSAAYMSPEQAQGQPAAAASDLYALGVSLFEAVTGKTPFDARVLTAQLLAKVLGPAPVPSTVCPGLDLPLEVEALIGELLEREPSRRPASANEVIARAEALLERASLPPLTRSVLTVPESAPARSISKTVPMLVARTIDEGWSPPKTAVVKSPERVRRAGRSSLWPLGIALSGGLAAALGGLSAGVLREPSPAPLAPAAATRDSPATASLEHAPVLPVLVEVALVPAEVALVPAEVALVPGEVAPVPGEVAPSPVVSADEPQPSQSAVAEASAPQTEGASPLLPSAPDTDPSSKAGRRNVDSATIESKAATIESRARTVDSPPSAAKASAVRSARRTRATPPETETPPLRAARARSTDAAPVPPAPVPLTRATPDSSPASTAAGPATAPAVRAPRPGTAISTWPEPAALPVGSSATPSESPIGASPEPWATPSPSTLIVPARRASPPASSAAAAATSPSAPEPVEPRDIASAPPSGSSAISSPLPVGVSEGPRSSSPPRFRPWPPGATAAVARVPSRDPLRRYPNVAAVRQALAAGIITPLQRNRLIARLSERRAEARARAARDYQEGRISRGELRERQHAIEREFEGFAGEP